jgi:hypothetical protein
MLAACSKQQVSAVPASGVPVLSFDGYGPVKFGTTLSDVEKQVGAPTGTVADPACSMVRFEAVPGVRFMVEQGVITRADADPGTPNSLGLKVGDTQAQATATHPGLVVGPHKYLAAGRYLTMNSPDARAAIVMEDDGAAITKIRAGLQPAVGYVETCL